MKKKHKLQLLCGKISNMFVPKTVPDTGLAGERTVTRAELTILDMVIESNLPLSVMDKFTKVVKIAFPDSEIASKFHCGRSKASCFVKESAAIQVVQSQGLALLMTGSTNQL